jgi:hypothetical protein
VKKVAIIQSNYIPWKGYFDIIRNVDLFIFLDHVQFTTRDWRTRNKIKTPDGLKWLTIPVGSDRNRRICDVVLNDTSWQEAHWKTIKQYYSKSAHFKKYKDILESLYLGRKWSKLSEFNQAFIRMISRDMLGLDTVFEDSLQYGSEHSKHELILDLCKKSAADAYISGPSANDYLDENQFRQNGIELLYWNYSGYPEYNQFFPPFSHEVTILDLFFHTGPDAPYYIWGWRKPADDKNKGTL